MKEFVVNGAELKCYPLTAAQRIHNYTIKFSAHQVLNIGTGFYIQHDIDFDILKKAIKMSYQRFDSMRLRFVKDEDDTVYQYIVPNDDRDIPLFDFSNWNEEDAHKEMENWTKIPFERYNSPMNYIAMIKLPNGYNGTYLKVDHMTMDSSSLIAFDTDVLQIYCHLAYGTEMPKPMMSYIKALEKDLEYEAGSAAYKKDEAYWMEQIEADEPMYTDLLHSAVRITTPIREVLLLFLKIRKLQFLFMSLKKILLTDCCSSALIIRYLWRLFFLWVFVQFFPNSTMKKRMYPSRAALQDEELFSKSVRAVQESISSL